MLPRSEQCRRIKIPLHGALVSKLRPAFIQRDAPVEPDNIGTGILHGGEQRRRVGAEVDHEQQIVANWDAGFNARRLDQVDIQPLLDADAIARCRYDVRSSRTEQGVSAYIVDIVRRTRAHPFINYGASPRASVALLLCSKALAAVRGRECTTPDDVRDIARPVLRHRLILRAEAELDGATPDAVITDILKSAEVPR